MNFIYEAAHPKFSESADSLSIQQISVSPAGRTTGINKFAEHPIDFTADGSHPDSQHASAEALTLLDNNYRASARATTSTHSARSGRVQSHLASGGAAPGLPRLGGEADGRTIHDGDAEEEKEGGRSRARGGGSRGSGEAAWLLSCEGGKDARCGGCAGDYRGRGRRREWRGRGVSRSIRALGFRVFSVALDWMESSWCVRGAAVRCVRSLLRLAARRTTIDDEAEWA